MSDAFKENLSALLDTLPVMFWLSDVNGRCAFFNDAWLSFRRRTLAQELGEGWLEGLHPDDRPAWQSLFADAVAAERPCEMTLRLLAGERQYRSVLVSCAPMFAKDGAYSGMVGACFDMTDRRSADTPSTRRDRRISEFAQVVSGWFWETDSEQHLSYSSRPVEGAGPLPFDPATEPPAGRATRMFWRAGPDGKTRWFRSTGGPAYDDGGGLLGYRGFAQDVTEEVQAKQAARRAQERFLQVIDAIPVGFALFDPDDRLSIWNQQFVTALGASADILEPGLRCDVMLGQLPRGCRSAGPSPGLVPQPRPGADWEIREHRTPDRARLLIAVGTPPEAGRQLPDQATALQNTIEGLREELAGRDAALDAARRRASDAVDANEAKSRFLANMSHEFRTPLNAIIGFTSMMQMQTHGPVGSDKYGEYLEHVLISSRYLLDLISDLMDLSRVESGKFEIQEEDVDVNRALDDVMQVIQGWSRAADIRLLRSIPTDLPAIRVDRRALHQIFMNVLSNAIKFTEKGGVVAIGARLDSRGGCVISFSDTGIGMDGVAAGKVFDMYARGEQSVPGDQPSTGLGLALVKALVESHDGTVDLETAVGEGTTLSISFPSERVLNAA